MNCLHDTILDMKIAKNDFVVVADFGEFGSIERHDVSEYSKDKKLTPDQIFEIIQSMLLAADSHEFKSLNLDQKI